MTSFFRLIPLLGLLILAGCLPASTAPRSTSPGGFSDTLDVAYMGLSRFHVTPVDMNAFTSAGFSALGLATPTLSNPRSGAQVGEALADIYRSNTGLQNMGTGRVMETFIEAGIEKTIGRDARFTAYYNEQETEQITKNISGSGGIGVILEMDRRGMRISRVRQGSPAQKAGLQAGDVIHAANGKSLTRFSTFEERIEALSGRAGSTVRLSIYRGANEFSVTLRREEQSLNDFGEPALLGSTAYIPLGVFDISADAYIRKAYQQLQAKGTIKGLILDLRNNRGGASFQAKAVSDLFLPAGRRLYRFDGRSSSTTTSSTQKPFVPTSMPLVVLVNGSSASASELVAGALQDQGRAVVIGSRSFGKGSQQAILTLPNGGAIAVTNAFIFRSTGRAISYLGIMPQVCTARVASGPRLIANLKNGAQPRIRQQSEQIRIANRLDGLCRTATSTPDKDLDLARALLTNPSAHGAAVGL